MILDCRKPEQLLVTSHYVPNEAEWKRPRNGFLGVAFGLAQVVRSLLVTMWTVRRYFERENVAETTASEEF
jgi:hypothetical protein